MTDQQIIIIGFMGAGKTTVAREVADQLNVRMLDLDDLITRRETRAPHEIITADGEERFREIETEVLRELLTGAGACVIAAGGGTWTMDRNRRLVAQRGASAVWLDAPFALCWKRIEAGGHWRPLATSREQTAELYARRQPLYELADVRIAVAEDDSAREIALKVVLTVSS